MNATADTDRIRYLRLLAEKYPSVSSLTREIINLNAILNLPKGTEHFMSDLHGEYEAFCHILNNCSGVVREKAELLFGSEIPHDTLKEICTLIYYPAEKLSLIKQEGRADSAWYRETINRMIELARQLSSKYTRSKVRKAMPEDYAYIIDELIHAQKDEDDNQVRYHNLILDTIIDFDPEGFILALSRLIKRLAVDHLHILGDIFDRGDRAEDIVELLMRHHSLDVEWGNHDILWMGAACGSEACIANVVRNSIRYNTLRTLENSYGISLRRLTIFAQATYPDMTPMGASLKAIRVIQFKLEGQLIRRHPEYRMDDRMLLHTIDRERGTVVSGGVTYPLNDAFFPTLSEDDPYALTDGERAVVDDLKIAFLNSDRLNRHVRFLYDKGSMYCRFNNNLLYHGCVPLTENGELDSIELFSQTYRGRAYLDTAQQHARSAFFSKCKDPDEIDFMWYLWGHPKSPLCGRVLKTFERAFIDDEQSWHEEKNPYYRHYTNERTCVMILSEFGLIGPISHIINGHTPVRTTRGELPIRANGKLLVIDGGFCRDYHEKTGIAGYTLIANSHGLRLKAHRPFTTLDEALSENRDIHSSSEIVETGRRRMMVIDTDAGAKIDEDIADLVALLACYRSGEIKPKK